MYTWQQHAACDVCCIRIMRCCWSWCRVRNWLSNSDVWIFWYVRKKPRVSRPRNEWFHGQSPWEASSYWGSEEIICLLRKTEILCIVCILLTRACLWSPSRFTAPSHVVILNICFKAILPPEHKSSLWSLFFTCFMIKCLSSCRTACTLHVIFLITFHDSVTLAVWCAKPCILLYRFFQSPTSLVPRSRYL